MLRRLPRSACSLSVTPNSARGSCRTFNANSFPPTMPPAPLVSQGSLPSAAYLDACAGAAVATHLLRTRGLLLPEQARIFVLRLPLALTVNRRTASGPGRCAT